jgi:hypothetical protein
MNMRNLNQIHSLAKYPMTIVMAQAWFLSTKCRPAVRGRGLLRTLEEDLA